MRSRRPVCALFLQGHDPSGRQWSSGAAISWGLCMRRAQLLVVSLLVAVVASRALAQPAPTFSQTYNYPDGVTPSFNVITATRAFESAAFDTATTFSTTLPFTFNCSGSVSTELHYSGSSLHWELDLGHGGGCTNSFTSALECDP